MKRLLTILLALAMLLSLAACGGVKPETAAAPTSAPETDADPGPLSGETSEPESPAQDPYERFRGREELALDALERELREQEERVYVYRDFGDTENHFTQKALIAGSDESLVKDMDENWREDPYGGDSCIRCVQDTRPLDWGGWLFLNGWLPEGSDVPQLNDGSMPDQGLDLSGADCLRFSAKGEKGGEIVEFFTCGFGYDGETGRALAEYPDSAGKRSLGFVRLSDQWEEYRIDLSGADLSRIVCGFGYVLSGDRSPLGEQVFYLDEIRFEGSFSGRMPLLRSYETDNVYIRNAAFSYDNALAAMALLAAGREEDAGRILDAFVYAVEHDRYAPGRVRNAYAAGDIRSFPGWDGAARLPGWYDPDDGAWYEDRYQTGSNVGNTSYVALALLQYDRLVGSERCRRTAERLMDWVIDTCSDSGAGFTGGYDGWPEGGPDTTCVFTYKSIEHNIDAYAAFSRLYELTGEARYGQAARSALELIDAMYDRDAGHFYTGTLDDGASPNRDNLVLDAQVWACLALGEDFAPYEAALDAVAAMETAEGGYPFCAANANGGWWAEGTAYTALMYRLRGEDDKALSALDALCSIQLESGKFPAATVENLSTGFELFDGSPWVYGTAPHLAPAAWFVMAAEGFNPYAFDGR